MGRAGAVTGNRNSRGDAVPSRGAVRRWTVIGARSDIGNRTIGLDPGDFDDCTDIVVDGSGAGVGGCRWEQPRLAIHGGVMAGVSLAEITQAGHCRTQTDFPTT